MKNHFVPIMIAALLISVAPSQARSRHRYRNTEEGGSTAEPQTRSYSGGGLSSNRGISNAESLAISAVLKEAAGARATTGDGALPAPRSGKYSPDYYRVYAQRHQMVSGTRRVAVATPAAAAPTPATPVIAKPTRVAVAPRVVVPTPPPVKPVVAMPRRVAVAPRVAIAPPVPVQPLINKPTRVAVAPRVAVAVPPPVMPAVTKVSRVAVAPRVAVTPPGGVTTTIPKPTRVAMAPRVVVAAPVPAASVVAKPKMKRGARPPQDIAAQAETPIRVLFR